MLELVELPGYKSIYERWEQQQLMRLLLGSRHGTGLAERHFERNSAGDIDFDFNNDAGLCNTRYQKCKTCEK